MKDFSEPVWITPNSSGLEMKILTCALCGAWIPAEYAVLHADWHRELSRKSAEKFREDDNYD